MSTRSNIIVKGQDGRYARVYCHFDGYPQGGVGDTLAQHYNSQERADELVKLGDMSSLAEQCDGAPGHSYASPVKGQTVYYGRDRGEADTETKFYDTLAGAMVKPEEYVYVWDGDQWLVTDDLDEPPKPLAEVLAQTDEEDAEDA